MTEKNRNFLQEHISERYNKNLLAVFNSLLGMGGMVEDQLAKALQAITDNDIEKAREVQDLDNNINEADIEINDSCIHVIATNQPIATDLRLLISVTKVVTDLERIGDEVGKLARVVEANQGKATKSSKGFLVELTRMTHSVQKVLSLVLDAFARFDAELALQVMQDERKIDEEYEAAIRVMITYMMENPTNIQQYIEFGWAARALERIGDHVRNIAEHTVFIIKGKDVRYMRRTQVAKLVHESE